MKLSKRDCKNLIDALMEYDDQVCPKELADDEVGLNAERYDSLMKRLTEHVYKPLPSYEDKFIWVLDASSGNVLRLEIPSHFPENAQIEEYEDYLEANLPEGIRLQDCNWLVAGAGVQTVVRWRYHKGHQGENNMACQQAKFTDARDLADFVGQLVQIGCEFDIVQTGESEWTVDLS